MRRSFVSALEKVKERKTQRGSSWQDPCDENTIALLVAEVRSTFHCKVDDEYLDFLRYCDGMFWNGIQVLASQRSLLKGYNDTWVSGLVEFNSLYRNNSDHYDGVLVYASDELTVYTRNLQTSYFEARFLVGVEFIERYSDFDHMITSLLESMISR